MLSRDLVSPTDIKFVSWEEVGGWVVVNDTGNDTEFLVFNVNRSLIELKRQVLLWTAWKLTVQNL